MNDQNRVWTVQEIAELAAAAAGQPVLPPRPTRIAPNRVTFGSVSCQLGDETEVEGVEVMGLLHVDHLEAALSPSGWAGDWDDALLWLGSQGYTLHADEDDDPIFLSSDDSRTTFVLVALPE